MRKTISKKTVAAICAVTSAFVFAACATGCGGSETDNSALRATVSYISTNSQVYSTTADVVEAVADTVVEISTESVKTQWGMQYIVSGAGSGVIVGSGDSAYYIITNNHVIEGANEITVRTRDGVTYSAELVATDDSADIAVVTVRTGDSLKVADWGNSDDLRIGEDLIAIGNPLGSLGGTVTKGILSATGRQITVGNYSMTLLQTDTAINPGNSGGGLFNMRGELIGVVNAKTTDEEIEGICFAIPANSARAVYKDLLEHGYIVGRATLSVDVTSGSISTGIGGQAQSIVYVTAVGDVAAGTFMQYDRVYSINDEQISTVAQFNSALAKLRPGDEARVKVYRGSLVQNFFGNSISFSTELTEFSVTATQYGA